MRYLLNLLVFFGLAAAIGLGLTGLAVSRNVMFGEVKVGSWAAYPSIGSTQPDPYARASIARRGRIPLALGDGLEFTASEDSEERPLRPDCEYRLSGSTLPARYWTVALQTSARPDAAPGRQAYTSAELLRQENGGYVITIAPRARPGNWLASGHGGALRVMLRLYDTPLTTRSAQSSIAFPTIERVACP